MHSGIVVICSYRPKPGKQAEVFALVDRHLHALRALRLITEYPHSVMQAEDGTVLEIFEWASVEAARRAEGEATVQAVWKGLREVADFVPLSALKETNRPFAHFKRPEPRRTHRVIHFEIHADDPGRCARFYETVFDWNIEKWGNEDYWLADTGEEPQAGIHGGIMKRRDPQGNVYNTIQVRSVDEHCRLIERHGGKIVVPKMPIPTIGWLAYGKDTEGNIFGIMQPDPTAQ